MNSRKMKRRMLGWVMMGLIVALLRLAGALYDGGTALHAAAYSGHLAGVEYLVGQGASLTATTNDGYTPKGLASSRGHTDVVAYLESVGG